MSCIYNIAEENWCSIWWANAATILPIFDKRSMMSSVLSVTNYASVWFNQYNPIGQAIS